MVFAKMTNTHDKLAQFSLLLAERQVDVESITDWLASLPLSHQISTSKLLYKTLSRIENHALSLSVSVALFNLVHRTLLQFSQQYSRDNLLQSLANYQSNLHVTVYLDCLQLRFAHASFSLLNNHSKKISGSERLLLCHRAMSEIGLVLLRRAQLYLFPAKGAWGLLHKLYRYAASEQLLNEPVTEVNSQGVTKTTVSQLYRRILLLGIADTAYLQQQDIERFYLSAAEWADKVHLITHTPQDYYVCLDTDYPPVSRFANHQNNGKLYCYIQLDALVEQLKQLLNDQVAAGGRVKQGLANHVYEHLITIWADRPLRKYTRYAESGNIEVCIGLAAVHYLVNNQHDVVTGKKDAQIATEKLEQQSDEYLLPKEQPATILKPGALHELSEELDIWEMSQRLIITHNDEENDIPLDIYKTYHWRVMDSSAQGYCLAITGEPPELIQVGKIIGVKNGSFWYVGTIRWLKYHALSKELRVGIMLIAPKAIGVALQAKIQNQQFHGLLLPVVPEFNLPVSLITPALIYQEGEVLSVQEPVKYYKVKLLKLLTQNHNYAHYEFKVV